MINNTLWGVFIFWGVWLAIPIMVDGVSTVYHLWLSLRLFRKPEPPTLSIDNLPKISIIIPAYNEQSNINHCLLSLRAQTYPHHLLEIIVVDDGSEDQTSDVVLTHMGGTQTRSILHTNSFTIEPHNFGGVLNLVRRKRDGVAASGKPAAVNAGLALVTGELIIALDSDVVLEPDAIEHTVRMFLADETLLAASGHLIIDPYLIYKRNNAGQIELNAQGIPTPRPLTLLERILTACQFIEYVTAFHLGRRAESAVDGMFTLSGACAVFRPAAFEANGGYRSRTVSEDTDMTMSLHNIPDTHIGYLSNMRVHLKPVLTLHALYAQRTRWQRGALEASAVHFGSSTTPAKRSHGFFWRIALPLRLHVDHTLAFPRLIWTFLIWILPLFGYSWALILKALSIMFLFYLVMDLLRLLAAYLFSAPPEKVFIRKYIAYLPVLPLYNVFLFWVRMNALISTLTEGATWTVQNPLLKRLETLNMRAAARRVSGFLTSLFP